MTSGEFLSAGMTKVVNQSTADPEAYWLRATAVGQQDEVMNDTSFFSYVSSATGAVLETASDGLRVGSAALGNGLAGGGAFTISVDYSNASSGSYADTDTILVQKSDGSMVKYAIGDATDSADRKNGIEASTSVSGTLIVDFDDGLYDNKAYTLTGNISSLTLSATRDGKYEMWVLQNGVGSHSISWGAVEPVGSPPVIDERANKFTVIQLFYYNNTWRWQ